MLDSPLIVGLLSIFGFAPRPIAIIRGLGTRLGLVMRTKSQMASNATDAAEVCSMSLELSMALVNIYEDTIRESVDSLCRDGADAQ